MTAGRLYRVRRRWPTMVAVAAAGALVGGGIGAGTVALTRDSTAAATVTATSEPPAPATPQPLERADRQTCAGWDTAGKLINQAADALSAIPAGTNILAPEVRNDPARQAAVWQAAELFQRAADGLGQAITPGATPILAQTSQTTVASLTTLATAYRGFDESSGDSITTARTAAHSMSALCKRLVH